LVGGVAMKKGFLILASLLGLTAIIASSWPQTTPTSSLIAGLKSYDKVTRDKAKQDLIEMGEAAVQPVLTLIEEENQQAKSRAAEAVAASATGNLHQGQTLLQESRKYDDNIQTGFDVLTGIGAPAVEPMLILLKQERLRYRNLLIDSLGEIGDQRAIEQLVSELDKSASRNATQALEKITGEKFGQDKSKWREWWAAKKQEKQERQEE
ncbi:MAG: hypothetical protein ACRD2R_00780, partial [Terriglobales bacterium]